jgi:uncharacterized protein YkwD
MLNLRTGSWGRFLVVAIGALLLAVPASASASGPWDSLLAPESACPGQTSQSTPPDAQVQTALCLLNYARTQQGLPSLTVASRLRASSLHKARDIRRCGQFSHEACGRDAFYWVRKVGYLKGNAGAGEILAAGSREVGTPRGTMINWLNSDEHRGILLTPRFVQVGISVVSGRLRSVSGTSEIWVAHFGYRGH